MFRFTLEDESGKEVEVCLDVPTALRLHSQLGEALARYLSDHRKQLAEAIEARRKTSELPLVGERAH